MESVSLDLCRTKPYEYKLCNNNICIKRPQLCPCIPNEEFRCSLGNCIPVRLKCDGRRQCMYGEDEKGCTQTTHGSIRQYSTSTSSTKYVIGSSKVVSDVSTIDVVNVVNRDNSAKEGQVKPPVAKEPALSLPWIVVISSVCVFLCMLGFILVYVLISRRNSTNTSRESQSAAEPLRKSYVRADTDLVEMEEHDNTANGFAVYPETQRQTYYFPKANNDGLQDGRVQLKHDNEELILGLDECNTAEHSKNESLENAYNMCKQNLAVKAGVEIYDIDDERREKISGLGRYTFKPRLKYLKSVPFTEIDEKDRENLYVINSYKHCAGKSILPATLNFDKDPEKFTDKFATDLLCSSTPKQPIRHLVKTYERFEVD